MITGVNNIVFILALITLIATSANAQNDHSAATNRQHPTHVKPVDAEKERAEGDVSEREQFFYNRLTSGSIKDVDEIHRLGFSSFASMDNRSAMLAESGPTWNSSGLGLQGYASGRVRSIAFDPTDSRVVYIAATVGGVWKTNDYTASPVQWQPLADNLPTLVCSCLAIPPQQPKTIYVGTGESIAGYVSSDGRGIFKSTDGGLNWKNILSNAIMGPTCSALAIDPGNPFSIYVAAPGRLRELLAQDIYGTPDTLQEYGVFHSNDGGINWTKFQIAPKFYPVSIQLNPSNTQRIWVTGFNGEIYTTTNAGSTWFSCNFIASDTEVDPVIAVAPSSPNVLYVSTTGIGHFTSSSLYESKDSGQTWQMVAKDFGASYHGYNNALVVDPTDFKHLMVGGVDTYEAFAEGSDLGASSTWIFQGFIDTTEYTHADCHFLTFRDGMIFAGNDGGISWYDGNSWYNSINASLPTLQFVSIDADKGFTYFIGGTQDNGTLISFLQSPYWYEDRGGDGGNTWVSPMTGSVVFSEYTNTNIYRSDDSGQTWVDDYSYISLVTNPNLLTESALFYAPYDASPSGQVVAFAGLQHIYVSTNAGDDGFSIEGNQTIDSSYAVRVSPYDSLRMWVGSNGSIWRSTDEGLNWTPSATGVAGNVVEISVGKSDATLYAIIGGLTSDSNAHFIKSMNGGLTWTKRATNFPMTPANSLARSTSGQLFVGTDYGVITSTDDGLTWSPYGIGLPKCQVLSLKVKGYNDEYLLAGTEGRGIYWLQIPTLGVAESKPSSFSMSECYPNPIEGKSNRTSTIEFVLTKAQPITLTLYDALGREVSRVAQSTFSVGQHIVPISTSELSSGEYFVSLQASGQTTIRKLTVLR